MSNFSLQQLTEGIRDRHVGAEGKRLQEKWARTGLLRGLEGTKRETMSRLLENQAAQVLREANTLGSGGGGASASGDLRGFTNIAFPIVRRVFGGLVANDLVSVQPMSLPSGLLFYLDYTYGSSVGGDGADESVYTAGQSIYNSPTGKGIQSGSLAVGGQYDLAGSGFSRVHKGDEAVAFQSNLEGGSFNVSTAHNTLTDLRNISASGSDARLIGFDPQVLQQVEDGSHAYQFIAIPLAATTNADLTLIKDFAITGSSLALTDVSSDVQGGTGVLNVRRLNQLGTLATGVFTPNPFTKAADTNAVVLTLCRTALSTPVETALTANISFSYAQSAALDNTSADGTSLVIPAFESNMTAGTPSPEIP